jgi:glycosyltransferase involved in cell wall biosynthesis
VVRRHGVDIIHANEQEIYPIAGWLAKVCHLPVVVSVHFTMERAFCEWTFGGTHTPDRVFFISRGSLEACRTAVIGIIPEDRWRLLPNGLDLSTYRPDAERRSRFRAAYGLKDEIAVGVGCAIRPRKQLEHLFEVAARLTDVPLRVFVAGGPVAGDEDYSARLLADAQARLGERFVFLGYLNELRDLYNGLDIFVNTSQEEACSISVLESLACGCPVLGYASRSVDDQVLPRGGEITAQDDVDALAAALRRWAARPDELIARRAGAREHAERLFDIRKLSQDLWREYGQLTRPAAAQGQG